MSITLLISLIVFLVVFFFFLGFNSAKLLKTISIIGTIFFIAVLAFVKFGFSDKLQEKVRYKPLGEADIIWNEADSNYYIDYEGDLIRLKDACSNQFGDYINSKKIRSNPKVNVYEKTYKSLFGIYYSKEPIVHFVHGEDKRIDEKIIELK